MDEIAHYNIDRWEALAQARAVFTRPWPDLTTHAALIDEGFAIQRVAEEHLGIPDTSAAPGSKEHFSAIAPPWLEFWAARKPVGMD